jgi:hypothetical protein
MGYRKVWEVEIKSVKDASLMFREFTRFFIILPL